MAKLLYCVNTRLFKHYHKANTVSLKLDSHISSGEPSLGQGCHSWSQKIFPE